jgi:hypothetical protein
LFTHISQCLVAAKCTTTSDKRSAYYRRAVTETVRAYGTAEHLVNIEISYGDAECLHIFHHVGLRPNGTELPTITGGRSMFHYICGTTLHPTMHEQKDAFPNSVNDKATVGGDVLTVPLPHSVVSKRQQLPTAVNGALPLLTYHNAGHEL